MKNLILVRHAKSSWEFNVIDHERPLNNRGIEDANLVSKHLIKEYIKIDQLVCSDAKRAKDTAKIFLSNLKINENIVSYNYDLYDFAGYNLIDFIKSCHDGIDDLMIFGHNHAITDFVNTYGDLLIDNVPTAGFVKIQFDVLHWNDIEQGKTVKTLFPRDLK
ncbi:histidine phosphatase family protein [Tamlana sp. 2_MG-2023]|uniref:SixA phosphatase family protein n=1 Tax=unclassified Tamlana TaxID=2614803 RepID=UPI0026E23B97|nr:MULTISPECIES: histidine phosphatase family protein [unclassified Tamlana]MDO6759567.1 histidine phosphatase family protein [Tamlana sp. 2_MG-2023]MDO6790294.1 histidine phosphatase family protein [Tamlana sp. 1_MG-2023]